MTFEVDKKKNWRVVGSFEGEIIRNQEGPPPVAEHHSALFPADSLRSSLRHCRLEVHRLIRIIADHFYEELPGTFKNPVLQSLHAPSDFLDELYFYFSTGGIPFADIKEFVPGADEKKIRKNVQSFSVEPLHSLYALNTREVFGTLKIPECRILLSDDLLLIKNSLIKNRINHILEDSKSRMGNPKTMKIELTAGAVFREADEIDIAKAQH